MPVSWRSDEYAVDDDEVEGLSGRQTAINKDNNNLVAGELDLDDGTTIMIRRRADARRRSGL